MKTTEYRKHLKTLEQNSLRVELDKVEQELFNLRLNVKAGQMKNHAKLSRLRRDVARIKTMLHAGKKGLDVMAQENITKTQKRKRLYQGVVISDKMQKTIVAAVETVYHHNKFGKTLRRVKKYKVHDEQRIAQVGDVIEFFSGRPVSKTKHMYLNRVVSARAANEQI